MSVVDIVTRATVLYKKYEKYDSEKAGGQDGVQNHDRFLKAYTELEADLQATIQKSTDLSIEKNRAVIATVNAEVRRAKAAMKLRLPKLEKYALKKVKGVSPEDLAKRPDMVVLIAAKIEEIPDGIVMGANKVKGQSLFSRRAATVEIKIDSMSAEDMMNLGLSGHSEESEKFSQEVSLRKAKQDASLDIISEGLSTLGNMAQDMGEELDRQNPLVDDIDTKVTKAETELRNTNTRLKDALLNLRSNRNFIVDIVLLLVVLSIIAYLYKIISAKLKS